MTRYVKNQSGEVFSKQDIILLENISIPVHITDLTHLGYSLLNEAVPTYNKETHNCEENGWEVVEGVYYVKWNISEKTQEEKDILKKLKVPSSIAMWQARDFLIANGLLENVVAVIDAISDPVERRRAQSKFEFSNTVRRDDPLLNYVCIQAGYTTSQVDDWFIGTML